MIVRAGMCAVACTARPLGVLRRIFRDGWRVSAVASGLLVMDDCAGAAAAALCVDVDAVE